ncbi:MAG: VWA domain-containing protein [Acetobacteraceae bacterium]
MDRLRRSCRRLIWLNPLLRWAGFEPKSQGIRAMPARSWTNSVPCTTWPACARWSISCPAPHRDAST